MLPYGTLHTLSNVLLSVVISRDLMLNYASVGGAPEAYGSRCVDPSVCACVILQRAFLRDSKLSNESCNATTARHSTTAKLARFLL